jgi:hypothetical protein
MQAITPRKIIDYAKLYKGSKDYKIYEYLKNMLANMELPEGRYEELIKEIAEILKI